MCLILLAHRVREELPLVFAANRDEFFDRPAAPAEFWADAPHVLGGRDLRAGGTWMAVARDGRWAAVTNYRGPERQDGEFRSRGHLVAEYLRGELPAAEYVRLVEPEADAYSGFNLLVGDQMGVHYLSNRGGDRAELEPGIYGLSNHLLDTPWPKVERGKRALGALVERAQRPRPEDLLDLLFDTEIAPDALLPDTGLGLELERLASAPFIVSPAYGTRASTALVIDGSDSATFIERSYLPGPAAGEERRHGFQLEEPR